MAKLNLLLFSVIVLVLPLSALTCVSNNHTLLSLCRKVAPKVEDLWGELNATVVITYGKSDYTTQLNDGVYLISLKDIDKCTMAHELTHVYQFAEHVNSTKWALEGVAQLTCYLLFPTEFKQKGFVSWIERGYGYLDDYDFGLVVAYYLYRVGNLNNIYSLSYDNAIEIFAKALHTCTTPYSLCPGTFTGKISGNGKWWANTPYSEGAVKVIDGISIFNGYGVAFSYPVPSPSLISILIPSILKGISSLVRRQRDSR